MVSRFWKLLNSRTPMEAAKTLLGDGEDQWCNDSPDCPAHGDCCQCMADWLSDNDTTVKETKEDD